MDTIIRFVKHDPLPVVGLVLIGLSGVLWFRILRMLLSAGYKVPGYFEGWPLAWTLPMAYLSRRSEQKWSPLPAYLIWAAFVAGCGCLIAGLFQLAQ